MIVAPGHSWSWISLLCTKACTIVCSTMPGSVHLSAVLLRKSSRLVATMAIHTADLIAVQERSLSSVMLENRSCSWSSYLGDGCWQPIQALCASSSFFFLLALNLLFPLLHLSPIAVVFLLLTFLPYSSTCLYTCFLLSLRSFSAYKVPFPIHNFCDLYVYFFLLPFPPFSLHSFHLPSLLPVYIFHPLASPSSVHHLCLFSLTFLTFHPNSVPYHLSALFITSPLHFHSHLPSTHFLFYQSLHRWLRPVIRATCSPHRLILRR